MESIHYSCSAPIQKFCHRLLFFSDFYSLEILFLTHSQMHHFQQLYDASTLGVNGYLPPHFPSMLPTSGVPIASAALARQLGVSPTALLTSSSPLIAVSTPINHSSPSPAPPPISPALSSPLLPLRFLSCILLVQPYGRPPFIKCGPNKLNHPLPLVPPRQRGSGSKFMNFVT